MKGKKGFVFTLISIVLSLVLLFSFTLKDEVQYQQRSEIVSLRVHTVNDFIVDVENDLKKGIQITSARTLIGIQEHITEQGEFIGNVSEAFVEGFVNGTIQGVAVDLLNDSTFVNWTARIQQQAEKTAIEANFSVQEVDIRHQTPWGINVTVQLLMSIKDNRNTAKWLRQKEVSAVLDITDFEDPLYLVSTNGKVTNTIRPTNRTPYVTGDDTTMLMLHANESAYSNSSSAPSYLDRMQGEVSGSEFGMESLVYIPGLQAQGLPIHDKSIVDHIYFSNQNPSHNRINNTPSWFKIDDDHLSTYGVEDLVSS